MSEQNRFWRIEQQVESLKAKTDRLEKAVEKLQTWAANHHAATVDKLGEELKDQDEVENP